MVGRDLHGRRFDSLVAHASEPWRMLAICVIGQALDDISPKGGPREATTDLMIEANDALEWVEGAPADMPASLACALAGIEVGLLRHEAEVRAALRWPALEATVAA